MDSECLELQTVRRLFDRTKNAKRPRMADVYLDTVPLVITMEEALREMGYLDREERRELRLYILSAIARRKISSTKDLLYASECHSIRGFISAYPSPGTTEDGAELLKWLARRFESGTPAYTLADFGRSVETDANLPDMPF